MKKVLVNCSNHSSVLWSEAQRGGWDIIVDVPFPDVKPHWDTLDPGYLDTLADLRKAIIMAFEDARQAGEDAEEYLMLQGEFSVCYSLFKERDVTFPRVRFVVPTTERVSVEETLPDGTTKKTQVFRFVRWRMV
jgi:hypothetical protein